ncbi:MAG TPA: DNA alkylation repair protein [Candidatus Krumholzibacteria bacterium]|nr:DNA alkylation repair protein [Candidatus Krumholzibacteria bacterium]
MTAAEIVEELKPLGSESIKKVLVKHGIQEPLLGVKVEELKKIQKRIKKDYQLALDLYDTGIYDAMYLAGLIADDRKMTKKDLQHWVDQATCPALCGFTVAWVAAESPHARALALEWIDSDKESVASAGWNTYAGLLAMRPDAELDRDEIAALLARVEKEIHAAPNRVRYCMNGFVIAVGASVKPMLAKAKATAKRVGSVEVDMGKTSCKLPVALDMIAKVEAMGRVGSKRKTTKC